MYQRTFDWSAHPGRAANHAIVSLILASLAQWGNCIYAADREDNLLAPAAPICDRCKAPLEAKKTTTEEKSRRAQRRTERKSRADARRKAGHDGPIRRAIRRLARL